MNIRLVRHAESTGNSENRWVGREDVPLSPVGRWQADQLRLRFEQEPYAPTHIYTSPLSRTSETARIVSSTWTCPIKKLDDLMEIDVGVISGMTGEEIEEKFPALAREFAATHNFNLVDGAESHEQCNLRAQRIVDLLAHAHENSDRLLLFSHGGIMRHIISRLLGTCQVWSIDIHNTEIFEFTIDADSWNQDPQTRTNINLWRIDRFGDTRHLDGSAT